MLAIQDYVSKATQDRVAWHLNAGAVLGETMLSGFRRHAELNLNLARATLEQGNLVLRQLLSARDARQLLSVVVSQVQPNALRTFDYGYYFITIAADTQSKMIRATGDSIAETIREWTELAEEVGDRNPYGWKAAVAFLRDLAESASQVHIDLIRNVQPALHPGGSSRRQA